MLLHGKRSFFYSGEEARIGLHHARKMVSLLRWHGRNYKTSRCLLHHSRLFEILFRFLPARLDGGAGFGHPGECQAGKGWALVFKFEAAVVTARIYRRSQRWRVRLEPEYDDNQVQWLDDKWRYRQLGGSEGRSYRPAQGCMFQEESMGHLHHLHCLCLCVPGQWHLLRLLYGVDGSWGPEVPWHTICAW